METINKKVIYKIQNSVNGKFYVGSTINLSARRQEHFRDLTLNKHHSKALQRAFNKYGKDSFTFEIIEFVEDETKLIEIEQFYIDELKPHYNCCKFAGSMLGFKKSEQDNLLNSLRNRGEKNVRAKIKEVDIPKIFELRKSHTVSEIAKIFNVSIDSISRILNGKSFKHLNLKPKKYKKLYSISGRESLREKAKNRKSHVAKRVEIKTLNGEFIGAFDSVTAAAKHIKMAICTLHDALNGKTKSPRIKATYL